MGFAINEMARLKAEVAKMMQERDANVAKTEQLSLEVQFVPELADEAKKLHDRVSSIKTSASAKVSKGEKSPATRSKSKIADGESEVEQAIVKLDALNAVVAKLKARTTDLERQLQQSASLVRVVESKYFLLYDET